MCMSAALAGVRGGGGGWRARAVFVWGRRWSFKQTAATCETQCCHLTGCFYQHSWVGNSSAIISKVVLGHCCQIFIPLPVGGREVKARTVWQWCGFDCFAGTRPQCLGEKVFEGWRKWHLGLPLRPPEHYSYFHPLFRFSVALPPAQFLIPKFWDKIKSRSSSELTR